MGDCLLFNAYEDMILLVCGLYGVVLLVNEMRKPKKGSVIDAAKI